MPATIRVFLLLGLLLCADATRAQVPDELTIQGMLFRPDGTVAPSGPYDFTVRIFKEPKPPGSPLVEIPVTGVQVTRGLYNITISGGSTPLADHLVAGGRFLELEIDAAPESGLVGMVLAPRQPLASVPYTFAAARAQAATSPTPAVPLGAILLWDQATGCNGEPRACPCGYDAAGEFAGRPVRGADGAGLLPDVPDDPGVSSGEPGGSGRFGDRLTTHETPSHGHASVSDATHQHQVSESDAIYVPDANGGGSDALAADDPKVLYTDVYVQALDAPGHNHRVENAGGGAHHHSFRSVFFCRRN